MTKTHTLRELQLWASTDERADAIARISGHTLGWVGRLLRDEIDGGEEIAAEIGDPDTIEARVAEVDAYLAPPPWDPSVAASSA